MSKVLGYKIKHRDSGLYLSSVSRNKWTKIGKTWPRKGDVIRHVNNGLKYLRTSSLTKSSYEVFLNDIVNWDIIELKEDKTYSIMFYANNIKT